MNDEPRTRADVEAWVERAMRRHDPFEHVRRASEEHRVAHGNGCTVYPTSSGPLLRTLAAAARAQRILEVGCGLGYSALCLAAGSTGRVDTIEADATHAALARELLEREGLARRVVVHGGHSIDVLPRLRGPYDLVFSDGDPEHFLDDLGAFERLVRAGGLLVSANLFLAQFVPELAELPQLAQYRRRLLRGDRWLTSLQPDGLALSVRL